ncbi:MAG: hypothetical protein LUI60_01735 [Clostridia bacterium]|nr:hypothetical protein [Clostridia bacterium]
MQLLAILALLMAGGKGDVSKLFKEAEPVLKSLGGEDMQNVLKQAEDILQTFSVLQAAAGYGGQKSEGKDKERKEDFPLAPITAIADSEITYRLTRYMTEEC